MLRTLHICDGMAPLTEAATILHWRTHDIPPGHYSAPALAQARLHETRKEFLEWLYEVAVFKVDGRRILEHLALRDGFSAWWLSLLIERFPWFYGQNLFEIFKLRALEVFLEEHHVEHVVVDSTDMKLLQTVEALCQATQRTCFLPEPLQRAADASDAGGGLYSHTIARLKKIRRRCSGSFLGTSFSTLRYLVRWWRDVRRKFPARPRLQQKEGLIIGTWFPNHDAEAAKQGRFVSAYIPDLMPLLDELPVMRHWLFFYSKEEAGISSVVRERDALCAGDCGDMTFWEECLTPRLAVGAFLDWMRVAYAARGLEKALPELCRWFGSKLDISRYVHELWLAGVQGQSLLRDLLLRTGIRRYMELIGPQKLLLTTSELQFWERFLFTEAHQRNISCFAAQNSVVIEADFRSCLSPRMAALPEFAVQMPDKFICNGAASYEIMSAGGYPQDKMDTAETLRYSYLRRMSRAAAPLCDILVVISGYGAREMQTQIALLAAALEQGAGEQYRDIMVKGHPLQPVTATLAHYNLARYRVHEVSTPVQELVAGGGVFYVANSTACAIEVMYAGAALIIQGAEDDFNFSPLSGYQDVVFVYTAAALSKALRAPSAPSPREDFFFIDEQLPKWRLLLSKLTNA